jgi:hypothetical protein
MEDSDKICFVVDNSTFVSSKTCLESVSDYFKAMLHSGFQEAGRNLITLSGLDAKSFGLVLCWAASPSSFGKSAIFTWSVFDRSVFP